MENQEKITQDTAQSIAPPPAAQPNVPPKEKIHIRRVGTVTMGMALIITGIALTIVVFVPLVDVLLLAKLSPLILVVLGIEMLVYSWKNKEARIRYDFLSIIMCLFIIFGAMSATLLPTVIQFFGPSRSAATDNISAQVIKAFKDNSAEFPKLHTISTSIKFTDVRTFDENDGLNELKLSDWLYVYVELNNVSTKEEFAKVTNEVYKKLCSLTVAKVQFTCTNVQDNTNPKFSVDIRGTFINEPSVEDVLQQTVVQVYNEDLGLFIDEQENERIKNETAKEKETENVQENEIASK